MGERTQQLDKSIWSVVSDYDQEALTDSHIQYIKTILNQRIGGINMIYRPSDDENNTGYTIDLTEKEGRCFNGAFSTNNTKKFGDCDETHVSFRDDSYNYKRRYI